MDGGDVATLTGVLAVGFAGNAVAVWTVLASKKTNEEQRRLDRLSDGYFDVVRHVELEALSGEADTRNWEAMAWEDWPNAGPRVEVPKRPPAIDHALVAAQLAAFGSESVRSLYKAWRRRMEDIEEQRHILMWNWREGQPDGAPDLGDVEKLTKDLQPKERLARDALGDEIARELGYRRKAQLTHWWTQRRDNSPAGA